MDAKFTEYGCIVPNIPGDELMAVGLAVPPKRGDAQSVSWILRRVD